MQAPVALLLCSGALVAGAARPLRSVLMIAVDDLRTQLSIYPEGGAYMKTPNIERLANRTVVFERAYVSVALCMPSRTALLTSRRPDTSRSWTIEKDQWFRRNDTGSNWTTLPGAFKAAGYLTLGMGKIFHEGMPADDPQDARVSWSPEAYYPRGSQAGHGGLYDPRGISAGGTLAHRFTDDEEPHLQDGNLTDHAVATIEKMANGSFGADVASGERPFFLAIGLHKPHVPWWCPARFWDFYPLDEVPPAPHPLMPEGAPAVSVQDWQIRGECSDKDVKQFCQNMSDGQPMSSRYPLDGTSLSRAAEAYQRQAYFACVSWMDANVGRILDAFDATQFARAEEGVVYAFWGDHGYHLGDNDVWAKMTNFEHATHIPLMIGCGGASPCVGRSSALVEALDIMPTILEEAGVVPVTPAGAASAIACPVAASESRRVSLCTEGRSLSALLRAPNASSNQGHVATDPFGAAFSQFPRPEHPDQRVDVACRDQNLTKCSEPGWCNQTGQCPNKMGYTIRTNQYRYTAWLPFNKCVGGDCPEMLADWDRVLAAELYNHSDAPVPSSYDMETHNIAGLESSKQVQEELHRLLKEANTKKAK